MVSENRRSISGRRTSGQYAAGVRVVGTRATLLMLALLGCGGRDATTGVQAPGTISYASSRFTFLVNVLASTLDPLVVGGIPSRYSVSPALPAGLALNASTGRLSGTPTAPSPLATYTVTALNSAGQASVPLNIDVAPSAAITVQVQSSTGVQLGSTFAGFSYEKSQVSKAYFSPANTALLALYGRLGPGVLRVGGNSVDKTTWRPTGNGLTAGAVSPADVDRLAAFLRAADWKVIYAMNFADNTPAQMADEAAYVTRVLGDRLLGLELGNECDLYRSNGFRPTTYSFNDFLTEWRAFAAAIQARVPGAVLTGPASAGNTTTYTVPFAKALGNGIQLLTQHYYRANGQLATSTMDLLLNPDPGLASTLLTLSRAAKDNGVPGGFRLDEANSFYNGGAPGISNGYGTALWAIDFLFANAINGVAGVNFHTGGKGPGYTPIADDGMNVVDVRPEFYGIYLFAMAAKGTLLATSINGALVPLAAYAVQATDGSMALVFVNRDRTTWAQVTVSLPTTTSLATLTELTGPSLDATTGELLNGAPINADGSWIPSSARTVAIGGRTLVVLVAPASAMLASVR